jgi:hypothetical protein
MARNDAYGQLPEADARGTYRLTHDYISIATPDGAVQLSKGGGTARGQIGQSPRSTGLTSKRSLR